MVSRQAETATRDMVGFNIGVRPPAAIGVVAAMLNHLGSDSCGFSLGRLCARTLRNVFREKCRRLGIHHSSDSGETQRGFQNFFKGEGRILWPSGELCQ